MEESSVISGAAAQGTEEWKRQRLGKITASRFCDMMTNGRGTGAMGKTAYSYMYDLIAERLTGEPQDEIISKHLDWGNANEPQARAMYCLISGRRVTQTGFIAMNDDIGGSPDGLVGDSGGVEIKCPSSSRIHLGYIEQCKVPNDYFWQVQGLMWVTGREWWDFVSFDPRMPEKYQLFVFREERDDQAIKELEFRAARFIEQMNIKLSKIESIGGNSLIHMKG